MGYDLTARNKELDGFHFGAFSFPILLEACGYLFSCIQHPVDHKWYCVFGDDIDPRMGKGGYPGILAMDGFPVTAFEAKVMARVARHYVILNDPDREYIGVATPPHPTRKDFLDKFWAFAEWAEKSSGFKIG